MDHQRRNNALERGGQNAGAQAGQADPLTDKLGGVGYAEGKALVSPDNKLPGAIPQNAQEIQQSIHHAGAAVTAKDAMDLVKEGPLTLKMHAGTRLSASVNPWGVSISSSPGLVASLDWMPDAVIRSLRYDFATASFSVDAAGLGPDAIWAGLAGRAANKYFKSKLPAAMQKAGYNPQADPKFKENAGQLGGLFGLDDKSLDAGPKDQGLAGNFVNASASVGFALKDELVVPIAGGDAEVRISSGTRFMLSAQSEGPVDKVNLQSVTLSATGGGIEIQKIKGFAASLQGLKISAITLKRGGAMEFKYDLVVEQMADGLRALARLFAAAATRDPGPLNAPFESTRLDPIRKEVDAKLAEELGPRVRELIGQYDTAIPGLSLKSSFGL